MKYSFTFFIFFFISIASFWSIQLKDINQTNQVKSSELRWKQTASCFYHAATTATGVANR
jgi:hypothetical protein